MIIHLREPLVKGTTFIKSLPTTANFTVDIFGGYDSASLDTHIDLLDVGDWIDNGLGRVVDIYADDLFQVYRGFVNEFELKLGLVSLKIGPLLGSGGVCNRVWSVYAPMDTSVSPPVYGPRTLTVAIQDLTSQAKYGVIEHVLSAGNTTLAVATQIQETYLREHIEPVRTHDLGGASTPTVSLSCLGFMQWLDAVIYENAGIGTVQLSAAAGKIQDVLTQARAINSWCVSSDYTQLAANAVLVPVYDADDMTCLSVLKAAASLGGPSYEQWMFGLYDNNTAEFKAVPTTVEYQARVLDNGLEIKDMNNNIVQNCKIRPGKWVVFTDLLPGKAFPANLRNDPRAMLIKRVEFSDPNDLRLNGADANTLPQILAQYGLGGM